MQAKIAKCLWFFVVCLGFVGAGVLMGKSYLEWHENPVATSISTLSISDLQFPNVNICPPKGSNTALNYDLIQVDGNVLTEQQKEKNQQFAYKIFLEAPFQEHHETLLQQINHENLANIFSGYQTIPKTIGNVTTTTFFSINGTYHTPGFGGETRKSFFESDQQHLVKLELPKDVRELMGSGSLVIDLEVDTRVVLGWNETVWIRNDTAEVFTYKFHEERKNWEDAEKTCDYEGGHLATYQSAEQSKEVTKMLSYRTNTWVGITDNKTSGVWELGRNHACIGLLSQSNYDGLAIIPSKQNCLTAKLPFICQSGSTAIIGKAKLRSTYTKEELPFTSFFLEYVFSPTKSKHIEIWKDRPMTGFKLRWKIQNENPPMNLKIQEIGSTVESPDFKDAA